MHFSITAAAVAALAAVSIASPVEEYLVPMQLQGKTFNLVLDTGSSDLWVFSNLQPANQQSNSHGNHTIYNTALGTRKAGLTYAVQYGDGSSSTGVVYSDKVTIGGVTVTSQAVEAATSVSAAFYNNSGVDGLLGMALNPLNTVRPTQQNTWFDNAHTLLAQPLYALSVRKQEVGSLDFGFINATKYVGKLNYINVTPATGSGFWEFNVRRFAVNGTMHDSGSWFNSIVDSGTSLLYLPDTVVKTYYASVPSAAIDPSWGGYTFPCSVNIPPMGIYIAGVKYSIPASLLNWEQINDTHCLGGLQSSAGLPFSILGDVFLKSVYVVFEQPATGAPRVGFAKQNPLA
ncbi:hypothetical protein ANO11243_001590 [Dothideomycetidae sp. 11243]|nr:hypothetical protein ANO11243_001590 [fungal sp. No.11243]